MKERQAVVAAYNKLVSALEVLKFTTEEYPEIPEVFKVDMQRWVESAFVRKRLPQHRPIAEEPRNAYALLLAVYETVFQRSASGSVGGPTFRFVSAFLSEMHDAMQSARWEKPPALPGQSPDFKKLFTQPPAETLRSRIVDAIQLHQTQGVGETLLNWLKAAAAAGRPLLSVEEMDDLKRKLEMIGVQKQ